MILPPVGARRLAGRRGRGQAAAAGRHRRARGQALARAFAVAHRSGAQRVLVPGLSGVSLAEARDLDVYVIGDVNPDILVIDDDAVPEFGQVEKLVGDDQARPSAARPRSRPAGWRGWGCGSRTAASSATTSSAAPCSTRSASAASTPRRSSVDPAIPTGATVVLGKGEHRALLTAIGTIDRLRAEDVPREVLATSATCTRARPRSSLGSATGCRSSFLDDARRQASRRRSTPTGTRIGAGTASTSCSRAPTSSFPTSARRRSSAASTDPRGRGP